MVRAVGRVTAIRRADCREFAEKSLASNVMADGYLAIYEWIIGERR